MDKQLLQWFNHVDSDGSGYIDAQELRVAMREGGSLFSLELCERICRFASGSEYSQVSKSEFVKLYSFLTKIQQSFVYFDFDKNGFLDPQESFRAVVHAGIPLDLQGFNAVFRKFDQDRDLKLNYGEYVDMMLHFAVVAESCKKTSKMGNSGQGYDRRQLQSTGSYNYRGGVMETQYNMQSSSQSGYSSGVMQTYNGGYNGVAGSYHSDTEGGAGQAYRTMSAQYDGPSIIETAESYYTDDDGLGGQGGIMSTNPELGRYAVLAQRHRYLQPDGGHEVGRSMRQARRQDSGNKMDGRGRTNGLMQTDQLGRDVYSTHEHLPSAGSEASSWTDFDRHSPDQSALSVNSMKYYQNGEMDVGRQYKASPVGGNAGCLDGSPDGLTPEKGTRVDAASSKGKSKGLFKRWKKKSAAA